jgi:hypothetical protein
MNRGELAILLLAPAIVFAGLMWQASLYLECRKFGFSYTYCLAQAAR